MNKGDCQNAVMEVGIRAEGLSIGYGNEVVVADIDFSLAKGEVLALVGTNGSGKTTLLKTIAGLLKPISGSIRVLGGEPLSRPGRVAYMGQFHPSSFMLPLRCLDVVRMARFAARGLVGRLTGEDELAVREAMEVMDVTKLADEPLNTLSGGQRQRVFIAQALARKGDLILLDEPATNLDAQGRETYRRLVREAAAAGRSAVVATHDIDEAAEYDRTMLMAHRVVAYGPSAEVLTPQALLSTFGIVGRLQEGRVVFVERDHGHECEDQ